MSTRTLGDNIRDARKKAGLTQMELAKATNLSRSYIGDIEKDRYNPSLSVLKAIAVATNTPLDTIISDQKLEWLNKEERKIPKVSCYRLWIFNNGTSLFLHTPGNYL